jgi:hypothetical protein
LISALVGGALAAAPGAETDFGTHWVGPKIGPDREEKTNLVYNGPGNSTPWPSMTDLKAIFRKSHGVTEEKNKEFLPGVF